MTGARGGLSQKGGRAGRHLAAFISAPPVSSLNLSLGLGAVGAFARQRPRRQKLASGETTRLVGVEVLAAGEAPSAHAHKCPCGIRADVAAGSVRLASRSLERARACARRPLVARNGLRSSGPRVSPVLPHITPSRLLLALLFSPSGSDRCAQDRLANTTGELGRGELLAQRRASGGPLKRHNNRCQLDTNLRLARRAKLD